MKHSHELQILRFVGKRHFLLAALVAVTAPTANVARAEYAWVQSIGGLGSGNGQLSYPSGLTIDKSGNLWVADLLNGRVQEFSGAGTYLNKFSQLGAGGPPCGCMVNPTGVAVDSSGNVWVAAQPQDHIWEFSNAGVQFNQVGGNGNGIGQLFHPFGVAVDASGNLWVADTENHRIQEFNSAGVYLNNFGMAGTGMYPTGLAVESSGNMWVADSANNRILKFSSTGAYLTQFGASGSGNGLFNDPEGVAIDPSGNLWVTDTLNNRVQEFSSTGAYLTQFGGLGSANGQFQYPIGVAVDSTGNVWVSDGQNNRVQEFSRVVPEPASIVIAAMTCIGGLVATRRKHFGVITLIALGAMVANLVSTNARADMAYAWGYNGRGQLGYITTQDNFSSTPAGISGLAGGVTAVAAGNSHSLAIQNGAAYAWGANDTGQLGNFTTDYNAHVTPAPVTGMSSGVTAIAGGGESYSLLIKSGGVWAFGYLDEVTGSGGGPTPVQVPGLASGVTAITAGGAHNLALQNGALFAWGDNYWGELGNGTSNTTHVFPPTLVTGMSTGVTSVAAGNSFSLVVKNGAAYAWDRMVWDSSAMARRETEALRPRRNQSPASTTV